MQAGRAIGRWLGRVLDLVFPPRCLGCGAWGVYLCPDCLSDAHFLATPKTVGWGYQGEALPLTVWSVGLHQGILREAVHQLKYEGLRALAQPMAAMLASTWRQAGLSASGIVPVPLHSSRQRSRGYNQSTLLARALAAEVGVPAVEGAVIRVRATPPQVGLSARERLANVEGAFQAANCLRGMRLIVLDDVCTSGATLVACAQAISQAGGEVVAAMTFTRAEEPG